MIPISIFKMDALRGMYARHIILHILINSDNDGCIVTSLNKLSKDLNLSIGIIRSVISKLESANIIEQTIRSKERIIRVMNRKGDGEYNINQQCSEHCCEQCSEQCSEQGRQQGKRAAQLADNSETYDDDEVCRQQCSEQCSEQGRQQGQDITETELESIGKSGEVANSNIEKNKLDYNAVMNFFNRSIDEAGSNISKIKSISDNRRKSVKARCNDYGMDAIYEAIGNAVTSPFLNGRVKDFKADFDWIMRPKNFPKVLEGNYNRDRYPASPTTITPPRYATPYEIRKLDEQCRTEGYARLASEFMSEQPAGNPAQPAGEVW